MVNYIMLRRTHVNGVASTETELIRANFLPQNIKTNRTWISYETCLWFSLPLPQGGKTIALTTAREVYRFSMTGKIPPSDSSATVCFLRKIFRDRLRILPTYPDFQILRKKRQPGTECRMLWEHRPQNVNTGLTQHGNSVSQKRDKMWRWVANNKN